MRTIGTMKTLLDSNGPSDANATGMDVTDGSSVVPTGWTPEGWAIRLDRMAEACEDVHPDKAREYRRQAAAVRKLHESGKDNEDCPAERRLAGKTLWNGSFYDLTKLLKHLVSARGRCGR